MSELAYNTSSTVIGASGITKDNTLSTTTQPITTNSIKQQQDDYNGGDKAVIQLLSKLDEVLL